MDQHVPKIIEARGLSARAVSYKYRHCPRCRRDWPADHTSCRECCRWLGEQPLQRMEWQLFPRDRVPSEPRRHECIGASAVLLRLVCGHLSAEQLLQLTEPLAEIFRKEDDCVTCGVARHGWLVWTMEGLRAAFMDARKIEQRLQSLLPRLESAIPGTRVRWGIWLDQYVLPFDASRQPVIRDIPALAIFNFEPDNLLCPSEAIYQANRAWEHFVCGPRRLLSGQSDFGFSSLGRKRPSALDQGKAADSATLVGREREPAILDRHLRMSQNSTIRFAVVAEAGSGKTRLVKEWLHRNPALTVAWVSFSLFGGDLVSLASQFVNPTSDRPSLEALLKAVLASPDDRGIQVLVFDDLHFADSDSLTFVRHILDALPQRDVFALLISRPSGRRQLESLAPDAEISLAPLSTPNVHELAQGLIGTENIAAIAAARSKGNPLFVEQFAAWAAETDFAGDEGGPRNLHQVISARVKHLSYVRLAEVRGRLRWGRSWEREAVVDDLDQIEIEMGLWLDRLDTGDHADRVEAAQYLVQLELIEYELFIANMLAGKPRPRSSRLREAIARLLIGSAEGIFADVWSRAEAGTDTDRANIAREALRDGEALYEGFNWSAAIRLYELALKLAPDQHNAEVLHRQLAECRRRAQPVLANRTEIIGSDLDLESHPTVGLRELPDVWIQLARRHHCREYFRRAAGAAERLNDRALAEWARLQAGEIAVESYEDQKNIARLAYP
jgi:AAA domain